MGTVHVAQASEEKDVIQTGVPILELLAAWVKVPGLNILETSMLH